MLRAGGMLASALALAPTPAGADGTSAPVGTGADQRFAIHGQMTYVEQGTNGFHAPYRGPNSLSPDISRETFDATLQIGARLWRGAEFWLNPEIDQGFGLDNTQGLAGFPSGEAYKVGRNKPYLRLPRAFIRQTINSGHAREPVEGSANQLAGSRSPDRCVFTLGKFSIPDVFDINQYAHDPRSDFLNWTAIDAGTFDYAADAWGFSLGASIEWYHGDWTLRGGAFDLSDIPNSEHLEPGFHEFQLLGEIERRYRINDRPGKLMATWYESRGRMALLEDAVRLAQTTGTVELAAVRRYRSRSGLSLGLEQQLTEDLGLFARVGAAGGNVEAYDFTDIDQASALGLSLRGLRWGRGADTVGIAAMVNNASATRERYLDAGGLGVLVGDGKLPHAGSERIVEAYYSAALLSSLIITGDFQRIVNPAYNRDRGPVSVLAIRIHAQF